MCYIFKTDAWAALSTVRSRWLLWSRVHPMVDSLNKYIACLKHTSINTWPILSLKFYCTNSSWSDLSESNRIHLLLLIRKQKAHFTCWLSLLIIFPISLNPDQTRQNVGPDLDSNCLPFWWCSKMFLKSEFCKKKITWRQKCLKILPACKRIKLISHV